MHIGINFIILTFSITIVEVSADSNNATNDGRQSSQSSNRTKGYSNNLFSFKFIIACTWNCKNQ